MPLVNLQTNLKSLRYGNDRLGAGSTNGSNQPYIKSSIPSGSGPGLGDVDFLLRGGSLLPRAVGRDVSRLTQMFFDLKSPNGLLFTVKQNVLSRSAVNIKATSGDTTNLQTNKLPLNDGIYLPTSTILQAAANPLGGHLLKQGINPFANTNNVANGNILSTGFGPSLPLSQPLYLDTVAQNERQNPNLPPTSRLIQFLDKNQKSKDTSDILYEYSGGPGSTLGVGKTRIKALSDQRTGINNDSLSTSGFFNNSNKTVSLNLSVLTGASLPPFNRNLGTENYSVFKRPSILFQGAKIFNNTLSRIYESYGGSNLFQGKYSEFNDANVLQTFATNVFQTNTFNPQASSVVPGLESTLNYNQLMTAKGLGSITGGGAKNDYPKTQILEDFRQKTNSGKGKLGDPVSSLDYTVETNRYEGRVKLGEAGGRNLLPNGNQSTSYVSGRGEALDKINALQIYKSTNVDPSKDINDLCKFRIGVIDNDNPSLKTYIHFRAFLDSMDDSYTANWSTQTFAGRAENLYNYEGFDRSFNLSWTVVAQSKQELIPMYQKLNYLASVCAPDYSTDGYMRGNLIELTVGGYLFNQVGIMKGIQYSIPMESPWEIALPDTPTINELGILSDPSVKELPFMIKVSGFNFIPIHNFVPNIQKNLFSATNEEIGKGVTGDLASFGDERYISLSNGIKSSNNYDNI